jgi:hypothetical protein
MESEWPQESFKVSDVQNIAQWFPDTSGFLDDNKVHEAANILV